MKIGKGLTHEKGDEETLAIATNSLLVLLEYIDGLIDNEKFEEEDEKEDN